MSDRDNYTLAKVIEEGKPVSGLRIVCAGCGDSALFKQTGNNRKPPLAATQYFRNHGWLVGNRSSKADRCPACVEKITGRKHHLTLVKKEEEPMKPEPVANGAMTIKAPPRSMSRDDRRIINDKLDAVYDKDRYVAGWSDARVARDLGIPQAWVAEVRDLLFGPSGSNPEFDLFLEKLDPMMGQAKDLIAQAAKLGAEVEAKADAARALVRAVGDLTNRIGELDRLAVTIKKETGK